MAKTKAYFAGLLFFVLLLAAGSRQLESSSWLGFDVGVGTYTATEKPFDSFPLIKIRFGHFLSRSWNVGAALAFTKWSDYLNMYGGKYTFYCLRPAIELSYVFPSILGSAVTPLSGIAIGYTFYRIKNELGNAYPGGLKDHAFVAPFIGANFGLGKNTRGIAKNIFLSARLCWNLNGDFSGLHGSLGLGMKIK
ncbi:MAG TPA: hypothetical protein VMZ49_00910 [Patescibacteria group bacterium]|nr:hypothetical protein [Patescibacteria group bacterium]